MKHIKREAKILDSYAEKQDLYKSFAINVKELIRSLLVQENIRFQDTSYQIKALERLKEKLERKRLAGKVYRDIHDIPDLARVRIILYFKDDIDKVIQIVEREFKFFKEENLDKEKFFLEQPDKFGYLSNHRVIALNGRRGNLKEYKRFKGLRCEVQIRTLLQHAWAEIEHDIGYKPGINGGDREKAETRRLLSQVAALLEVADDNFIEVRKRYNNFLRKHKNDELTKT